MFDDEPYGYDSDGDGTLDGEDGGANKNEYELSKKYS